MVPQITRCSTAPGFWKPGSSAKEEGEFASRQPSGRRRRSWVSALCLVVASTARGAAAEGAEAPWKPENGGAKLRLGGLPAPPQQQGDTAQAHGCGAGIAPEAFLMPLNTNCQKAESLQRFWDGIAQDKTGVGGADGKATGGVVYWHPEQTGGGSMCRVALAENLYSDRFWERIPEDEREAALVQLAKTDCRSGYVTEAQCIASGLPQESCVAVSGASGYSGGYGKGYGQASFDPRTWDAQAAAGRRFFAMQPSDCWDDREEACWHCCARTPYPSAWYAKPWFQNPASDFWTRWSHVITVRNPAERAYSDFLARHFGQWWCMIIQVWERECFNAMLTPAGRAFLQKGWDKSGHNGTALVGVVENRLISNTLIMHLSGTPDNLELAKSNLRKMTLVLDFKARREESYFLLRHLYFWSDAQIDTHVARFHDNLTTFKEIRSGLYEDLKQGPLSLDFELWEYALELIDSHAAALGFKRPLSRPSASG